jgi:hypothetical protein
MRIASVNAIVWVVVVVGAGCRKEAIHNVVRAPIAAPATISASEMSQVLIDAGERAGWRLREAGPGRIRAEKQIRSHRALSEIRYDTSGYSVTLLQADNLLYDGAKVHKIYNVWVEGLQKSIEDEIRFRYP